MKLLVLLALFGVVALTAAKPMTITNVQENFSHIQEVDDDGDEITGTYRWVGPEGDEFFVTYVADDDGFRVIDSNAIPATVAGLRADGSQGSFVDLDDDDDDDNDSRFDF